MRKHPVSIAISNRVLQKIDQEASKKLFAADLVGSEFSLPDWLQTTPRLQNIGFALYTYGGMRLEERWRIYRISKENSSKERPR